MNYSIRTYRYENSAMSKTAVSQYIEIRPWISELSKDAVNAWFGATPDAHHNPARYAAHQHCQYNDPQAASQQGKSQPAPGLNRWLRIGIEGGRITFLLPKVNILARKPG